MIGSHGVVIVLPGCTLAIDQVPPALADLVDPHPHRDGSGPWWRVPGLADGAMFPRRHRAGVDLLVVTYSSTPEAEDHRPWTELLIRGARELGARYGFVTRRPEYWGEPLLTVDTIAPLEARDWAALRAAPHEAWLFTTERPEPLIGRHLASGPWGAVLGRAGPDGEPPHRILVPPPGWTVQFTNLRQRHPDDLGPDDDWYWFLEDISYFRHDSGVGVDIGWHPDQDPAGCYRVAHVDEAWQAMSPRFETRSLDEVVAHVERLWRG